MLMRIRNIISQTNDHSVENRIDRWQRFLAFAAMIAAVYMLVFDTVPGLVRRDIHELPDGLLYLYFLIHFSQDGAYGCPEGLLQISLRLSWLFC